MGLVDKDVIDAQFIEKRARYPSCPGRAGFEFGFAAGLLLLDGFDQIAIGTTI